MISEGSVRAKMITAGSGGGGTTYCNLQPPEGEIWNIYALVAVHDDIARTIAWGWNDSPESLLAPVYLEASVAGGVVKSYHKDLGAGFPVQANRMVYPWFRVDAAAAARTITCYVVYERIVGAATWQAA